MSESDFLFLKQISHCASSTTNLFIFLFFSSAFALASPTFSIQGQITNADGTVYINTGVQFLVQVISPSAESCVLYSETQTKDVSASGGFSLILNDGTGTRTDGNSFSFTETFSNVKPFLIPSTKCGSGSGTVTYTPQLTDERRVIVYFKDVTMISWEAMPETILAHSAFSFDSLQVGGFPSTALCRVATGTTPTDVAALTPGNFAEMLDLINGSSGQYVKASSAGGAVLPSYSGTPTTAVAGSIWYDTSTQTLRYNNGSTDLPISSGAIGSANGDLNGTYPNPSVAKIQGYAVSNAAPANGQTLIWNATNSQWEAQAVATSNISGLGTAALRNAPIAGNATGTEVVLADDTRLTDARPPGGSASGDLTGTYPNPTLTSTAVSAGNYGSATEVPSFNVDEKGRLTSATNTNISFPVTTVAGKTGAVVIDPSDITSAPTKYFTYKPNNTSCTEGEVLKWDNTNSRWSCASDSDAAAGGFVSAITVNAPITNSGTTSAPNFSVNSATTAAAGIVILATSGGTTTNTVVEANDSRLSDSRAPNGAATGDLSANFPSPTVSKIQGTAVSAATPTTNQFFKFNGSSWAGGQIYLSDLQSSLGGNLFYSSSCTASQSLAWNSGTDQFSCSEIGNLNANTITTGTLSDTILSSNIPRLGAGNTWTSGAQDFSSTASLTVPISAGATPTASARIAYDSSTDSWRAGVNGISNYFATAAAALTSGQLLQGDGQGKVSPSGLSISIAGSIGLAPSNSGISNSLARNDHVHKIFYTLQWFFPGPVASGVQSSRGLVPLSVTGCMIVGAQVSANTAGTTDSTYNIERCTAAGPSCTSTTNIYSSNPSLTANSESGSEGAPNTTAINAGDIFRVNLISVGTGLSDVNVSMTYKCENTN